MAGSWKGKYYRLFIRRILAPMTGRRTLAISTLIVLALSCSGLQSAPARRPLTPADIDDIAQIVMLEDTRRLDTDALGRLLKADHPEVRRRAIVAVGRIVKDGAATLLAAARDEKDPEILATVAWAAGQLKDADSVAWLSELLTSPSTPPAVAKEAACALGKIRSPQARETLAKYLSMAPATKKAAPVIGEALLSF